MDEGTLDPKSAAVEHEANPLAGMPLEEQIAARQAEIEALKQQISALRDQMKQPDNSHLEQMSADEVLSLMPDDLVLVFKQGDKVLNSTPIVFKATKKVTSLLKSRVTFSPKEGGATVVPITAKYQIGLIVPFGKREPKEKKKKEKKQK